MTAVRYDMNEGRNRPVRGDHRGRDRPRRVFILGEHCDPADCDHPIHARRSPLAVPGYIARCGDCGLHQRKHNRATWEIAL